MPWGVAAAAVSAGVGAYSSSKAAKGQQKAADAATAEQARQFDLTRSDQAPYQEAGTNALAQLVRLSGEYGKVPTAEEVMATPGYQFGLDQGRNALQGAAAAQGGLYSGDTLKDLTEYGNDYATSKYDQAFNRQQAAQDSIFNRYASLSKTGQVANNQVQSAGQNYANNVGNIGTSNANAQGAATIAQGNALQNGINQGVSWYQNRQQPAYQAPQSSFGYGTGTTYDPNTGATLFADGGAVRKPEDMLAPMVPEGKRFTPNQLLARRIQQDGELRQWLAMNPDGMRSRVEMAEAKAIKGYASGGSVFGSGLSMARRPKFYQETPQFPQLREAAQEQFQANHPMVAAIQQPQQPEQPQQLDPSQYRRGDGNVWQSGGDYDTIAGTVENFQDRIAQHPIIAGRMQQRQEDRRIQIPYQPNRMMALAGGGSVHGPGGPREDLIPAMLSDGEHVMDAASVNAIGGGNNPRGQNRLNRLRAMVKGRG